MRKFFRWAGMPFRAVVALVFLSLVFVAAFFVDTEDAFAETLEWVWQDEDYYY